MADWQALLDLTQAMGWPHQYTEGGTVLPLPRAETALSRQAEFPELRVWPTPELLAIFRFLAHEQIDFDIDLRDLQGQEQLDAFCAFLCEIGRRLGKPVLMNAEGDTGHPVLGYECGPDRVAECGGRSCASG